MNLHRYTVFELEMIALRNWLASLAQARGVPYNSAVELQNFLKSYLPKGMWGNLDFAAIRPTQTVKVIYLKSLGVPYREIQTKLSMSPNRIQKVLQEGFIPSRPDDLQTEVLLNEWKKLRPMIPNEIFIKWLK